MTVHIHPLAGSEVDTGVFNKLRHQLDVPAEASAALIGSNVNVNSLGKAQILGLYGR